MFVAIREAAACAVYLACAYASSLCSIIFRQAAQESFCGASKLTGAPDSHQAGAEAGAEETKLGCRCNVGEKRANIRYS